MKWNPKALHHPQYPHYSMHNHHLKALLGIKGALPAGGTDAVMVQGWMVAVLPKGSNDLNPKARRPHRIVAVCPDCGQHMSAGRTHQHKCKEL